MSIKSNDLKKGAVVKLKNGWMAVIADNLKGQYSHGDGAWALLGDRT